VTMPTRKRTKRADTIPLELNKRERELIINKLFAGPDLTDRLRLTSLSGADPIFRFTLEELEELAGYVAAEANHAKSKKLQNELDRLSDRIEDILEA